MKAQPGGRKVRPCGIWPTRWAGAGLIPARGESTAAVAAVQESLSLRSKLHMDLPEFAWMRIFRL
jgi:hypothetical protein